MSDISEAPAPVAPVSGSASAPVNKYATASARNYALVLLTIVYSFNFIDRQLLAILQESIKLELTLSDSQLGLLTGFANATMLRRFERSAQRAMGSPATT